jgi:hypothetical protein
MSEHMKLEIENKHIRDENIVFYEEDHWYSICGSKPGDYVSATTRINSMFPKFREDMVIKGILKSKKMSDPNYKYYGHTAESIKQMWEDNRVEASTLGTRLHRSIELFYNDVEQEEPEVLKTKEYGHFERFYEKHKDKKAFRTEWSVYDEEIKTAGQIDMCYLNDDGTVDLYDWKRSKEIKKQAFRSSDTANDPIDGYPNSNFWKYSFQLNLYKYMIEKNYGYKVRDMYIVVFHPNNDSFMKYKISNLNEDIQKMCDVWRYKTSS